MNRIARILYTAQELITSLQIQTVEDLMLYLKNAPKEETKSLQKEIDKINQQYISKFKNMETLFHGTTNKIADQIKNQGFKLTKGKRSGFMGLEKSVKNQAIFLSDNKSLAHAFGANRDPYEGKDSTVIEIKANINNTLDMTKWNVSIPKEIRQLSLQILSEYEGKEIKKPTQTDMFWMIDQPQITEEIKKSGYDSVRFSESRETKKALGADLKGGDTIAVFDPNKLHILRPPIKTLQDIVDYMKNKKAASIQNKFYPKAGSTVNGLKVRHNIPNTSSIKSSFNNYEILKDVREIPISELNGPKSVFYATDDFKKSRKLAEEIQQSNEINPLIIAIDNKGPYILEGAHRYVALCYLNKTSFPALIVLDQDDEIKKTASELVSIFDVVDEETINDEQEEIYDLIDQEEEKNIKYKVQTINAKQAKKQFVTMQEDMTVFESFTDHANDNQKEIVKDKMRLFDASRIIVTSNNKVVDGNHHLIAAIKLNKPVKYINLQDPIDSEHNSKNKRIIAAQSNCPIHNKIYGGLPEGGGYISATEYEIGAVRFAEAAHCILGSLFKASSNFDSLLHIEKEHLKEEMGIMKYVLEEYIKDLYTERIWNNYPEKYKEMTIKSIKSNSPNLKTKAQQLSSQVEHQNLPQKVSEIVTLTYNAVIQLADVMLKSIKDYPTKIENAYKDPKLNQITNELYKKIEQLN